MLRHLGALPFCKTNVPQIMYSWECSNPVYGTTTHPLHLDYIPGGSSGGEACLIAQGIKFPQSIQSSQTLKTYMMPS